jgi:hypothetical protein
VAWKGIAFTSKIGGFLDSSVGIEVSSMPNAFGKPCFNKK